MIKIIKFTLSLMLVFFLSATLTSCEKENFINNSTKKIMINDVNYSSPTKSKLPKSAVFPPE